MRKIKFEKNSLGCFTDEKTKEYQINLEVLFKRVSNEIRQGTIRHLVDVFSDKVLWIVVPVTKNGNTVFEKVRAVIVNFNLCPNSPMEMFDEYGRWWEIKKTDVAFLKEEDADKMEFFSNLIIVLENKKNNLIEILKKSPIEIFGEENCPSYEECMEFAIKILADLENVIGFIFAAKKIISEIGEDE